MNKQTELQQIATAKGLGEVGYRPRGGRYPLDGWYILSSKPMRLGFNAQQAKKKLLTATPNRVS